MLKLKLGISCDISPDFNQFFLLLVKPPIDTNNESFEK